MNGFVNCVDVFCFLVGWLGVCFDVFVWFSVLLKNSFSADPEKGNRLITNNGPDEWMSSCAGECSSDETWWYGWMGWCVVGCVVMLVCLTCTFALVSALMCALMCASSE